LARPRERGLKPERGAVRAAAERSGAALIIKGQIRQRGDVGGCRERVLRSS
jgi:hypothetical protein